MSTLVTQHGGAPKAGLWRVWHKLLLLIALVMLAGQVAVAGRVPATPDTPAGQTLQAWLTAFNSGSAATLAAFDRERAPTPTFATSAELQSSAGGYVLVSILRSEDRSIRFKARETLTGNLVYGVLSVNAATPAMVTSFSVRLLPPDTAVSDPPLDAAERKRVIAGIMRALDDGYIYLDGAHAMDAVLQQNEAKGTYDHVTDGSAFASMLAEELQAVSHDHHLYVDYAPYVLPQELDHPDPADQARFRKDVERHNCAISKLEVLPGNIGYMKIDAFPPPDICGATAVAAMGFLAHVDAIIFDLRENHGGSPAQVELLLSYLFDAPTHLNDLYYRRDNSTTQYWTLPYVPGTRLPTQPAYVLVSHQTFSGGEEFTNDLKTQKRATIVGETTGGGAHPVGGVRIDDHFVLGVPGGRPINPITKTDWEGTGVAPDVKVPAADALETAEKLAAAKMAAAKK